MATIEACFTTLAMYSHLHFADSLVSVTYQESNWTDAPIAQKEESSKCIKVHHNRATSELADSYVFAHELSFFFEGEEKPSLGELPILGDISPPFEKAALHISCGEPHW